jgi:4-aminobutyrate aminotransferase / (S)-3-amino-2-methylpropionate transaminase / 5-aminovalerate transaminase
MGKTRLLNRKFLILMTTTQTKAQELLERRKKVVANAIGIFNPATAVSAKGSIIVDTEGRELIDFAGGIGVLNAGHSPQCVVDAIKKQAETLIHTCFNVAMYDKYIELAEKLVELFPHGENGTKVMITNSGAEAVENAVKIARQATGKSGILCFTGAFHGRTMMAMTLTAKSGNKLGCGPFAGEVYRIDYPNYFRYGKGFTTEEAYIQYQIQKLDDFFLTHSDASNMAAVIIELVQGEGGFHVCPPPYLAALQRVCKERGMLLIIDEVQSGFGRTGKWAAYEHYGITPDISTWAKSMGSGMPIGCVIGRAEIMDAAKGGTLGGTYVGNPVCCAASIATIDYMKEININALGEKVGKIVRKRFEDFMQKFPLAIGQVRGLGAMLAFELVQKGDPSVPDTQLTKDLVNACEQQGLIIISAGTFANVIRILSPLVITDDELTRGLDILETELSNLYQAQYGN